MWIQTQNKQMVINSDQIIDIYINKTGTHIYANTIDPEEFKLLGEYKDRDTCLKVLEHLQRVSLSVFEWDSMPLDDEINKWLQDEEM